jgi:hypothetical protein
MDRLGRNLMIRLQCDNSSGKNGKTLRLNAPASSASVQQHALLVLLQQGQDHPSKLQHGQAAYHMQDMPTCQPVVRSHTH